MTKIYAINVNQSDGGWCGDMLFCINTNKLQTENLLKRLKLEFPNQNFHLHEFIDYIEDGKINVMVYDHSDYDEGFCYEFTNVSMKDYNRIKLGGSMQPHAPYQYIPSQENLFLDKRIVSPSINKEQLTKLYNYFGVDDFYEFRSALKFFKMYHTHRVYGRPGGGIESICLTKAI